MKPIFDKIYNQQFYRYIIAGVSVAVVNLVIYSGLQRLNIIYTVANICAIVISKIFGYFMNKNFVYRSYTEGVTETLKEMLRFILARGFTGVLDFFGVVFLVELINLDKFIAKGILIAVVILLNYVLGKKVVFKK